MNQKQRQERIMIIFALAVVAICLVLGWFLNFVNFFYKPPLPPDSDYSVRGKITEFYGNQMVIAVPRAPEGQREKSAGYEIMDVALAPDMQVMRLSRLANFLTPARLTDLKKGLEVMAYGTAPTPEVDMMAVRRVEILY